MRRCRPLLGCFVEIAGEGVGHVEAGFAAVAKVHELMSIHAPDSELSRLNREGARRPVALHPWTAAALRRALFWAEASDGLFDPTIGAWMLELGFAPRHPGQPDPDPQACWRDVETAGAWARFRRPCVLDLGGIAKGFAVDKAVEAMIAAGARRGLVNGGGDLRGFGELEWPVTLADPRTRRAAVTLGVREAAVATSALLPAHLPGWRRGGHLPLRDPDAVSATVAAPTATDADALTKVVIAGGPRVLACLQSVEARALRFTRGGAWEALA